MEQIQDAAKQNGVSLLPRSPTTKAASFKRLIEDLKAETQGLPLPEVDRARRRAQRADRALQGRARGRRPHREPGRADQRGGGVRRGGARGRVGRGGRSAHRLPHARRAGSRRAPGGRGPGRAAADDGALGEGPGVRRRVPHRPGGGPVPARAERRTSTTAWRRSAASPTSPSPARATASTSRTRRRACCTARPATTSPRASSRRFPSSC